MKRHRKPRATPSAASAAVADINITPMVDVLLCLLIFVIVIQPGLTKGLDLQVPPPDSSQAAATVTARDQLVLHVGPGPTFALNDVAIPDEQLTERLRDVFAARQRKVLFVDGHEEVPYAVVIDAIDRARGAGVRIVGLVPR